MTTLLEKALVRLLNNEQDKAEDIMHQHVLLRSRQIHEKLRQSAGPLENWDDTIISEGYFTETDLDALEDEDDPLEDAVPEEDGEEDGGQPSRMEEALHAGRDQTRKEDLDDHLGRLTAEFEAMMARMREGEGTPAGDGMPDFVRETAAGGDGDDEFENITEAVLAELDTVLVTLSDTASAPPSTGKPL